jgi:hypothetical protein
MNQQNSRRLLGQRDRECLKAWSLPAPLLNLCRTSAAGLRQRRCLNKDPKYLEAAFSTLHGPHIAQRQKQAQFVGRYI